MSGASGPRRRPGLLAICHLTPLATLPSTFTAVHIPGVLLVGGTFPVTAAATARHPRTALLYFTLFFAAAVRVVAFYVHAGYR